MFNGGTRKRVVSDEGGGGGGGGRGTPQHHGSRGPSSVPMSPKRIKLSSASPVGSVSHSHGSSTPHSMQSLSPPYSSGKPIHIPHSAASLMATSGSAAGGGGRLALPSDLPIPFSRSFMMDYMWHHQQNNVQHGLKSGQTTSNIPTLSTPANVSTPPFPIPPYAIPWLKRPSALFFPPVVVASGNGVPSELPPNSFIDSKAFSFYNNSAFKPVSAQSGIRQQESGGGVGVSATTGVSKNIVKDPVSSDDEEPHHNNSPVYQSGHNNGKHSLGMKIGGCGAMAMQRPQEEEEDEEDDDEILVDIETTEDDEVQLDASSASPRDAKNLSPKLYSRPPSSSPTILQLDPNNNTREVCTELYKYPTSLIN